METNNNYETVIVSARVASGGVAIAGIIWETGQKSNK
jgi:hypothetical protein